MITENLSTPVLLGLPFVKHNNLAIFGKDDFVVHVDSGWDLLSGRYIEAPLIGNTKAKQGQRIGSETEVCEREEPP